MKNGIEAMITDIDSHYRRSRRTTQARTGFYTAASATRPKKPIFAEGKTAVSGVTATRQSATASGQPVRNGKPPRSRRSTLKQWRT